MSAFPHCQVTYPLRDYWSGLPLDPQHAVASPHFAPSMRGAFVPARRLSEKFDRREAAQARDEFEASCNTCSHWERQQHPKRPDGALVGSCGWRGSVVQEHTDRLVWPDDFGGMPCHQPRDR